MCLPVSVSFFETVSAISKIILAGALETNPLQHVATLDILHLNLTIA